MPDSPAVQGVGQTQLEQLSLPASASVAFYFGEPHAQYVQNLGYSSGAFFLQSTAAAMIAQSPTFEGLSFNVSSKPIETFYFETFPIHARIKVAEMPYPEIVLAGGSIATIQVKYEPPRPLLFSPAPEKLRYLYDLLSKELSSKPRTGVSEELSRALLPLLGKIFRLDYQRVALEITDSDSIFFNLKFKESITVHLEIYIEQLQDLGNDCFFSCYRAKKCIRTGHGSIVPIISEIMTATAQADSAQAAIA